MKLAHILLESSKGLDSVASSVRLALNIADSNANAYAKDQKRYSENYGGKYYLFMFIGLELYVIQNYGINEVNDSKKFATYIQVKPCLDDTMSEEFFLNLCDYLSCFLQRNSISCVLDLDVI